MPLVIAFLTFVAVSRANLYEECGKLFNPYNYLDQLPPLHLPYVGNVPIPFNVPNIRPSPPLKTKVVNVVTKYVYKNPVCVVYSKRKNTCKSDDKKHKNNLERLVTKEYFVKDREKKLGEDDGSRGGEDQRRNLEEIRNHQSQDVDNYDEYYEEDEEEGVDFYVQSSEDQRQFTKNDKRTPHLTKKQIYDMLIEDRLDQLETILPHYTRRRVFETSTITVTGF
ncbi:hypothetical protein NQ317_015723 [Molorchus minor]|uniref:Uncharacterized protein n=1 Tax=Molorchus minor TaxID=1323400 RepID=A0ABQ9IXQ2_9CUCU|nr:hypothetical protein NQ317_015723 [Molorchus minor]